MFFDEHGAIHPVSSEQVVARIGWSCDCFPELGEINGPMASPRFARRIIGAASDLLDARLVHNARDRGAQAYYLRSLLGRAGSVTTLVDFVELTLDRSAIAFLQHVVR